MRKYLGLCLVLVLGAMPVVARQIGGEEGAWDAYEKEQNDRQKAQKGESFVSSYKTSGRRPKIDLELVKNYIEQQDWPKAIARVEDARNLTMDPKTTGELFAGGMTAALGQRDYTKTKEYGGLALKADPDNATVLVQLTYILSRDIPKEAAAITEQLNKAAEYANRFMTLAKPANIADTSWAALQTRGHANLGYLYWLKGNVVEAGTEYSQVVRTNPRDHEAQYRVGVSNMTLMLARVLEIQQVTKDINAAEAANKEAEVDELISKQSSLAKDVVANRDSAINSLAFALALGGDYILDARKRLTELYTSKNKGATDKDVDAFVEQKKAELPPAPAGTAAPAAGQRGAAAPRR